MTNGINFEGWGLNNIQNTLPGGGVINRFGPAGSSFFVDQFPTNALATGDSHTYFLTIDESTFAQYLQLQATLVWTGSSGRSVGGN